ncbi:MAG: hypothetical protein Q7S74_04580 [Nanoarchaeota archaeon]|nr:hypothetical protein [Nanoarchaeota archaeon]
MRKIVFMLISFVFLVSLFSLVMAAKPEMNNSELKAYKAEKNMTYGSCVSENAKVKNECYVAVKNARASCLLNASDGAVCKADYKKDLKQCKADFKASKKECKKIKHSFFETTRYTFA